MSAPSLDSMWVRDLPVCFPGHPCVDYSPYEADAINITSALTPINPAIAIGCFVLLAVALVLTVFGLRVQARRPVLRVVGLTVALILLGALVESIADLRLDAIAVIFGLSGPGSSDLYGQWLLVGWAGAAMVVVGIAGLAIAATLATVRLRNLPQTDAISRR